MAENDAARPRSRPRTNGCGLLAKRFKPEVCRSQIVLAASSQLTFPDDTLMAVERTLDAILVIVCLGRQQSEDLTTAAKRCRRPGVGQKPDGLPDGEFMSFHARHPSDVNAPSRLQPA